MALPRNPNSPARVAWRELKKAERNYFGADPTAVTDLRHREAEYYQARVNYDAALAGLSPVTVRPHQVFHGAW